MTHHHYFFADPPVADKPNLVSVLKKYASQIDDYEKGYFSSVVTSGSYEGELTDCSLYILVPEITYEYKALHIEIKSAIQLRLLFYTLLTKQVEEYIIDISNGTNLLELRLTQLLSSDFFRKMLEFLVGQVQLRRLYNDDIKSKIKIGEARVITLYNGERRNAGFKQIDGEDVIYYTGKGLREMFKPSMNEEEKKLADALKKLSQDDLIRGDYMAINKIYEIKTVE